MNRLTRKQAAWMATAVGGLLLFLIGWTSWRSVKHMQQSAGNVQQTYAVLNRLETVFSLVKDAESAQRGFVITGRREYLGAYESAENALPKLISGLRTQLAAEGIEEARISRIEELINEKMEYVRDLVAMRSAGRTEEALEKIRQGGRGLVLMDELRGETRETVAALARQLQTKSEQAEQNANQAFATTAGSLGVHTLLLLVVASAIRSELKARSEAEEAMTRARDAAVQSAKMKSEFLANMSHEIRTPMNGVIGMLNLLLDTKLDRDQKERAETAKSSAESLLTILNDILDFSKIEAGKLSFEMANFGLREIVESSVETLAAKAQEKKLELASLVYADVPEKLQGDPSRLRQVLVNLIGNAVKFTKSGEVVVRVKKEKEEVSNVTLRFSVNDTGVGIPAAAQQRLFTPFTQADSSTTRQFGGTGLGLAISRQLVEGMGGEIGLNSSEGLGSEFWFTARFEKQPQGEWQTSAESLRGKRVLAVDDNATNREILRAQLGGWGLVCQEAASAEEALAELRTGGELPDLLLMDMQMPGKNGLELAREVKREFKDRMVLVLLTSGAGHESAELKEAGFKFWLHKPVKQSALMDCLISALTLTPVPVATGSMAATKRAPEEQQPFGPLKLLLAEDNRVNQLVAQGLFERWGYRADVAGNGLEALEACQTIRYDVVFMDCQMPELDGYEAARRIRSGEGGNYQPYIIAMTANAMQGDREKCIAAGMDDYVSKPFSAGDVRGALERFVKKHRPPEERLPILKEESMRDLEMLNSPERPGAMAEVIQYFLEDAPPMLQKIKEGMPQQDDRAVGRSAHKLAGSASIFGATRLVQECRKIEDAAVKKDWALAGECLPRLEEACAEVEQELRKKISS